MSTLVAFGVVASSVAASVMAEEPIVAAAAATYPPISVFVGYADNTRASGFFPNPWQGSSNTSFVGAGPTYDSGAIRLNNPSSSAVTVTDISVDIGTTHFDLWGSSLTLPAGGNLIVAQTSSTNFDTSDVGTSNCTKTGFVPKVHVTINGITTTYADTRQVLNTGGFDLANCPVGTNESHQWQVVGGGPTAKEMRGGGSRSIRRRTWCPRGRYPVNCATGEFYHTFKDLAVPGRGLALDFSRTYSSLGASQNGPLGYGWTDSYNMSLSIDSASGDVTVNEETGSQVTFTPIPSGFEPPSRVIATLAQNPDGTYTFVRWDGERFTFNSSGGLIQESDRNGYKTTLAYNTSGELITVADPAGRSLNLNYTGALLSSVVDPAGRTVSFTYDGNGNLTSAVDVDGGVTKFTYDPNHLLLTMTTPNGGTISNVYDSSGRITSQTDPMNRTTTYSYTPTGTTITDPNGNVEVEQYENNELTSLTEGSGTSAAATWTYAYDPSTLGIVSVTDPDGHTSTATYDASANLLSSVDALNRKTAYTYDSLNDLTSMSDPLGITWTWSYDANGNLLTFSKPLTSTSQTQQTLLSYGDSAHPGDLTSRTDPNGKVWTFGYDAAGDLVSTADPQGDRLTMSYDNIGRETATVTPNGNIPGGNPSAHTTAYSYDASGNLVKLTDPLGHATTSVYDGDHNRTSVTDPNGRTTSYIYDLADELVKITRADGTALNNGYDADGNLISQVNGLGNGTSYGYDSLRRLTSTTDPLKRTTSYGYDGVGNLTSLTDPAGQVTTYIYDQANELTGITYSDSKTPDVTYSYDADGRRASMTDGTGTSNYSYDSLDRLTASSNGAGQTVRYSYDLVGNITGLTYPNGQLVNQGYDAARRLTSVSDWLGHTTTFAYDADGNLTTENYPNTVQASYGFDSADHLNSITDAKGGNTFASFTYSRDANGQLTGDTSTGLSQPSQSYSYDQVNRLSTLNSSNYGYDAADNITKLSSGTTLSYDAANQLTAMSRSGVTTNFTYDSRGNRLTGLSPEGTAATYSYDQADRLTAFSTTTPPSSSLIKAANYFSLAVRSDGTVWAWGYNVFGQLGNGTTATSTVPVQVSGLVGVTQVAAPAGGSHGEALKNDGTVWTWGYNGDGELGNGTLTNSSVPVQVSGVTGATAIGAGNNHGMAVKNDGTVWTWGYNAAGELGNGTTTNSSTPVQAGSLSGVTAVAAGGMPGSPGHSLALKSDGTVWAWGYNKQGQLGNGTTTNALTPMQVSNLSGISAISANGNDSFALKSDGTVWAWGDNGAGQLGNTSAGRTSTSPVQVNITGVTQVSNGADFALALKSDGTAWGWGDDASGQLGDGGACGKSCVNPVKVNSLTGVAAVSSGYTHSLSITNSGTSYSWGQNGEGQLGNGTTTSSTSPVQVNNFGTVKQAPASATYTYDGNGFRASRTVGSVNSRFAWDFSHTNPTLVADGSANYIYGPGGAPLEQIAASGTVFYFHQDQLGSTRILTDSGGNVQATYSYDPYGGLTNLTGTASTPLEYAGQFTDAENGLQYLRARFFDPTSAQFISRDPLTGITRSPYAYGNDAPTIATDPSGLNALPSGFDPSDPNYCWNLLQLIRATNNEIGQRYREQQWYLSMGQDISDPQRYRNHMDQLYQKEARLRSLINEWKRGPCGGSPLPRGATDWAYVTDPVLDQQPAAPAPQPSVDTSTAVAAGAVGAGLVIIGIGLVLAPEVTVPALVFGGIIAL